MEDSSRHSQFGTDLCESPPHALLSASPSPNPRLQSVPGVGGRYEKAVVLRVLDLQAVRCVDAVARSCGGGVCLSEGFRTFCIPSLQGLGCQFRLLPEVTITLCGSFPSLSHDPFLCPWFMLLLGPSVLWSLEVTPHLQGRCETAQPEAWSLIFFCHFPSGSRNRFEVVLAFWPCPQHLHFL